MAYAQTEVAVDKSQSEIRKLLHAHGAANFSFGEGTADGHLWAIVEFVLHDQRVRIRVPLKAIDHKLVMARVQRTRTRSKEQITTELAEQEARRIWRVLVHGLKARMVSVEEGVESFEEAFLPHLVDPVTNLTLWDTAKHMVEAGVMKFGGLGMEIGPPRLSPAPAVHPDAMGRNGITGNDTAHVSDDADVVDAEVVG